MCENLELKFTIPSNKSFTLKNLACSYHWQFENGQLIIVHSLFDNGPKYFMICELFF